MRLLTGEQLTHIDFQNVTASYRLSSFIEQLRNRHNWPIETKDELSLTSDKVRRIATYGRYFIEADVLIGLRLMLGVRLDKFIQAVKRFERVGNGKSK